MPVGALTTYPGNPRRGNIDLIRASLAKRGQYKPVVISSDLVILVGNHTYLAAVELGWATVEAVQLELDSHDPRAAEIVLVDNRASDIGGYSEQDLADLLGRIPNLETADIGYDESDLAALVALLAPYVPGHGADDDQDVLEGTDRDGWPVVTFKLAPAYAQRWALLPGDDDTEHAVYLMDAVAM